MVAKAERDVVQQACQLTESLQEVEKYFVDVVVVVSQFEELWDKAGGLEWKTTHLEERNAALNERYEAMQARRETAQKSLGFGEEAFQNFVEQVVALNPGVPLWIAEAKLAYNVFNCVVVGV